MGSCCEFDDLQQIDKLSSEKWQEIIPKTRLQPGYEATRHNYQKVSNLIDKIYFIFIFLLCHLYSL